MTITKEQIDALVDGLNTEKVLSQPIPSSTTTWFAPMIGCYRPHDLKRALYLAAGLTAEGERKPERVRCWMYQGRGNWRVELDEPVAETVARAKAYGATITPGWFVPDGAE